jgi:serine/threonine protein kinase
MADRWDQIQDLYHRALARSEDERSRFLTEACAGEDSLRQEVESLLKYHSQAQQAMEQPAATALLLESGQQVGSYKILSMLGAGGMGEVYRARDLKLKREVAIKILPEEFSRDRVRVSRFQREAELLASLNHPNIAAIYDLAEASGTRFLVLELVDGETLGGRIARGAIPVREALNIAIQICEALEAAHERGIIHRDLKPANIKLTADGKVKVLDFGLAKAMESTPTRGTLLNSPTLPNGSMTGMIVGTAAYMSPEQARGKEVDRTADMWAFGCVLYEMLTGRPAFDGENLTEILGRVVTAEPEWDRLPSGMPPSISRLLRRALKKASPQRLADMRDARIEIEDTLTAPPEVQTQPLPSRGQWLWPVLAAIFFLVAASAVLKLIFFPTSAVVEQPTQFDLLLPEGVTLSGQFKISPDGRKLAFVATSHSKQQIWVRPVGSFTAEPLPSTEGDLGVGSIFWSGDSQNIAYFTAGQLKWVAATGGPSRLICHLKQGVIYFGTWNADGVILLGALQQGGQLLRVSASGGGEPVPVGELDAALQEVRLLFPAFLPDQRHYFYLAAGSSRSFTGYIGTLDSKDRYSLPGIASPAQVSSSGHIFFVRDGRLMAQSLDLKRFQLSAEAFPISDVSAPLSSIPGVPQDSSAGLFTSVSSRGSLAYVRGKATGNAQSTQLMWFDGRGKPLGLAGPPGEYQNPDVTPDGRLIAFQRGSPANIYVLDTQTGVTTHVTTGGVPVWGPDKRAIVFLSNRDGALRLYTRFFDAVGGEDQDKLLLKIPSASPDSWSKNKYITYETVIPHGHIWAYSLTDSKAKQVTFSESEERGGRLSPDGHWLGYTALEQGQSQVFIQSFPDGVIKRQVSTRGGFLIRWRPDGKELYYLEPDATLMAVSIRSTANSIDADVSRHLFKAPIAILGATIVGPNRDYDVTADGRFLINVTNPAALNPVASPISVDLNWTATLDKK